MDYTNKLKGKSIAITGGTGSFGNIVTQMLLKDKVKRIIIFSRDEKKQNDMRLNYMDERLEFFIGDVRDKASVLKATKDVDYIFHAAALKQVPSCELFPMEAVKTNIIGASNVLSSAIENNVSRVVVLSTDKAVYPINAMGLTKALMEKIMIASARELEMQKNKKTVVCGVRYGNVLYSRGSVLPYFVDLIKENKPLVVTNKNMTRFLLPLSEAVDLVLYALIHGENGDVYVRKSPACTIGTLAEAVSDIFRKKVAYKEIGIRVGEKMHETLVTQEEFLRSEDHNQYYCIHPEGKKYEYEKFFERGTNANILSRKPYTSENTSRLNVEETKKLLLTLPEIQNKLC